MSENEAIYKLLEKTKSDNDIFICRKCGRLDFRNTLDVLGSESGCCGDCGSERHYEVELFGLLKRITELEVEIERLTLWIEHYGFKHKVDKGGKP